MGRGGESHRPGHAGGYCLRLAAEKAADRGKRSLDSGLYRPGRLCPRQHPAHRHGCVSWDVCVDFRVGSGQCLVDRHISERSGEKNMGGEISGVQARQAGRRMDSADRADGLFPQPENMAPLVSGHVRDFLPDSLYGGGEPGPSRRAD